MLQLTILFFLLLITWAFAQRIFDKWRRLPPGPIRWPILGSMIQLKLQKSKFNHLRLWDLSEKYGDVMSFGYGVHYAIVISSYEVAKDLFRHQETSQNRFVFDFLLKRSFGKNLGIIFASGDVWREQKRYTAKILRQFGYGKRHLMESKIKVEVDALVEDISQELNANGGIWDVESNRLAACNINILWSTMAGFRFDPKNPELKRNIFLNNAATDRLGTGNPLGAFPFLKIFSDLSGYTSQLEIFDFIQKFMLARLDEAKERRTLHAEPENFVDYYLDEIEKNKSVMSYTTEEQLLLILMDFFQSGSDTVGTTSNWFLLYLGLHTKVQAKVREEINSFLVNGNIPSSEVNKMTYTQATILETFRKSTLISTPSPRRVEKDVETHGYRIPKDTCLLYNFYPMFNNRSFWGDPENFRPERFIRPDGTLDPIKTERMHQFGIGPRLCLGEPIATQSVFMIVTELVKNFSFETIDKNQTIVPEKPSIILRPTPFSLKMKQLI